MLTGSRILLGLCVLIPLLVIIVRWPDINLTVIDCKCTEMAEQGRDTILDPQGAILDSLFAQPQASKRTRRQYTTPLEREEGLKKSKRKSEQSRITIGNLWPEWEKQRMLCGIQQTKDFVAHLLAVHAAQCPQFCEITGKINSKFGDSDDSKFECVPETPKRKRKCMPIDDSFESPLIPIHEKATLTYESWKASRPQQKGETDNVSVLQSSSASTYKTTQTPLVQAIAKTGTSGSQSTPPRDILMSEQSCNEEEQAASPCEWHSVGASVHQSPLRGMSERQSPLQRDIRIPEPSSPMEKRSTTNFKWQPTSTLMHQTPTRDTDTRAPLLCSTPVRFNQHPACMIPEDEITVLTPVKDEQPTSRRRLTLLPDLPHSPKLFEDDVDSDEFPMEMNHQEVHEFAEDKEDDDVPMPDTNWRNLRVSMGTFEAIEERKCIAFGGVLEKLLRCAVGEHCRKKDCRKPLVFKQKKRGTCLLICWECPKKKEGWGHFSGVWSSQPRVHGMDGGTVLTSMAIVLSGNNYGKIALMAKFLGLNFMSKQVHNCIQRRYIKPGVDEYWIRMQDDLLRQLKGGRVVMSDGRNESPGHRSTLLTYTSMDVVTKKIIAMAVVDCLETNHNSVAMEKLGFQRVMDQLLGQIEVAEVVTDAHPQIRKLMRTDARYSAIQHQWDVWHFAKNFAKKLAAVGKERGMKDILPWIPAIKNHLWYASRTCGGDADKLKMVWQSVLYHICNKHEWLDTTGHTAGRCDHEVPLPVKEGDKAWIKPGSEVQKRLIQMVRKKQFVNSMSYLTNFRHTGDLELFHSHLLMYCPKRLSFSREYYEMRNKLAIFDYNEHIDRPYATDSNGETRYWYYWSKGTERWSATPAKVPKRYLYMTSLMAGILAIREREAAAGIPMSRPVFRPSQVPRRNIAKVPRPPTAEILAKLKRRF